MTIVDETGEVLDRFRTAGNCELCGKHCQVREPAHVYAKGRGSANRLDVSWNLIALGSSRSWQCPCHASAHAGMISYFKKLFPSVTFRETEDITRLMLDVVAKRDGLYVGDIMEVRHLVLRLDKHASHDRLLMAANELTTESAKVLYIWTMRKAEKLV